MGKLAFCPNCGTKEIEQVKENVIFCKACNMSFGAKEGKIKADDASKDYLTRLQEYHKEHEERISKIEKTIFPVAKDSEELF